MATCLPSRYRISIKTEIIVMLICINTLSAPLLPLFGPISSTELLKISSSFNCRRRNQVEGSCRSIYSRVVSWCQIYLFHLFARTNFGRILKWSRNKSTSYRWPRCHGSRQNLIPSTALSLDLVHLVSKTIPMSEFRASHKFLPLFSSKRIYDTLGLRLRLQRLFVHHPGQYSTSPSPEQIAKEIQPKPRLRENPEPCEKPDPPPHHFLPRIPRY